MTIVSHSRIPDPETKKQADKVEILGEAWDDTLGGRQFDYEIVEILVDKFNKLPARKNKPDIRANAKAMRRFLEKAEEVKCKLSATKSINVFLDNLADYVLLTDSVNREEFDPRLVKFQQRINNTINEALKDSNLKLSEINDIELIGGGLRPPKIFEIISLGLNNSKTNQKLNPEEAISFVLAFWPRVFHDLLKSDQL